jgi:hypothetical protein
MSPIRGDLCGRRDLGRGEITRHDDLHEFHIVGPVEEIVDDARALMHAVATLDQGFDTVIVKPGPAAEHISESLKVEHSTGTPTAIVIGRVLAQKMLLEAGRYLEQADESFGP